MRIRWHTQGTRKQDDLNTYNVTKLEKTNLSPLLIPFYAKGPLKMFSLLFLRRLTYLIFPHHIHANRGTVMIMEGMEDNRKLKVRLALCSAPDQLKCSTDKHQ